MPARQDFDGACALRRTSFCFWRNSDCSCIISSTRALISALRFVQSLTSLHREARIRRCRPAPSLQATTAVHSSGDRLREMS